MDGSDGTDSGTDSGTNSGTDLRRIQVSVALPCAMRGCQRPTTWALLERDVAYAGLWSLLPICPDCTQALQRAYAAAPSDQSGDQPVAGDPRTAPGP